MATGAGAGRHLPAMHRLLEQPAISEYAAVLGREPVKRAVERALDRVRASGAGGVSIADVTAAVVAELGDLSLRELIPAINATGILLHTNLGRAPLAREALAAVDRLSHGYSNLEFDLASGERGSRYDRVTQPLCELTGAQDALVVNNCAAALLLILDTFAKGREAIVSRGQLVEIGGGFRIPDVLERSGATLREAGTTNRTRVADFEAALSPRTAVLLRVHPSNYRIEGFTAEPSGSEVVGLARRAGALAVEDLGSGAPVDLAQYGLPHERTIGEALADGMDLVTFSGDKLLGGPQAGIVAGRAAAIARLRANPLLRALRVDKMTLGALAATIRLHRDADSRSRIPLYRMLATPVEILRARAEAYLAAMPQAELVESEAFVGGGALPQARIPSAAIALRARRPATLAAQLRRENPAIVARVDEGRLLFDLRTVAPEEDDTAIATLTWGAPDTFEF